MNLQVQQEYAYTSYKLAPRASAPPRALPAKPERGFFLSDHHQAALPGGLFHWETAMNVPNEPNLPSEGQFGISIPEGFVPEEPETDAEPSAEEPPASEPPEPPPAGELPPQELPPQEPPPQEPPIVRHDPFAHIRTAPWMNRALDASGRAAAFLRRLLQDFAAIEGRQPNRADLDDIVKRTTDYMIPSSNASAPPTPLTTSWRSGGRPGSPRRRPLYRHPAPLRPPRPCCGRRCRPRGR
jgi:hypothetical protein